MAVYSFDPTPGQAQLLAQIRQRESSNNYRARISPQTCAQLGQTNCTASGAYAFTDSTWQMAARATGVGTGYSSAADAEPWMQDVNALWLLRYAGNPNASIAWAASGPYDASLMTNGGNGAQFASTGSTTQPLVDLSGDSASTPTASILSQLNVASVGVGTDMASTVTAIAIAAGAATVLYLASR